MSEAFQRYMQLRTALGHARRTNLGEESDEENSILNQMDGLWWAMTNEEQQKIEAMDPISVCYRMAQQDQTVRDCTDGINKKHKKGDDSTAILILCLGFAGWALYSLYLRSLVSLWPFTQP